MPCDSAAMCRQFVGETFDEELSLSLEVFGCQFDLTSLRELHVSDGQSVNSTSNPSFHLQTHSESISMSSAQLMLTVQSKIRSC